MPKLNLLFLSCAAALSLPIAADEIKSHQSFSGYTGLINTPNAEALSSGSVDIGYNNLLDFKGQRYLDGHNFIFSAGLFEGLEVSGQISSNSIHDNMFYSEGRGQTRDLSFNAKYQLPYIPKDWFSVAIGAKDIGGAANNYKTFYAVASKELWDFRFSAGLGSSDRLTGEMDGAFAGIEWQPLEWFSLLTEYDAEAVNAAARITIPKKWLYDIGEITFTSRFYSSTDFSEDKDTYWGVNFTLPLSDEAKTNYEPVKPAPYVAPTSNTLAAKVNDYGLGFIQTSVAPKLAEQPDALTVTSAEQSQTQNSQKVVSSSLSKQAITLKDALINDGFENVVVGYNSTTVFVNFENSVFNRNDIDAIGVVLGRIAENIVNENTHYSVQLSKTDIPLLAISGNIDNYRLFIEKGVSPDLNVQQDKAVIPEGVTWAGKAQASPYFKPRVTLSPAISNTYATELGVFDYSIAIRADVDVPLWKGAGVILGGQVNVENSDDYDERGPFRRYRQETEFDRAMFYQTFKLPFGFYNQTQVGFIKERYDLTGITNETTWLSDEGRHRISAQLGSYKYEDYRGSKTFQALNYQYNWVEQDITLHAQAGNYWYEDSGYKLESRFWFGDSYLAVYYEDTNTTKAGLAFSIPLSPRKDMKAYKFGQIKGTESYRHTASTEIGESTNRLVFSQGFIPGSAISTYRTFLNQGRMSSDYVYQNLARLKEAYLTYR